MGFDCLATQDSTLLIKVLCHTMEKPNVSGQNQGTQTLKSIILSDFWIKMLLLVALLGCLYTVLTVQIYQNRINNHWIEVFKRSCGGFNMDIPPTFQYDFFNFSRNGELKNFENLSGG